MTAAHALGVEDLFQIRSASAIRLHPGGATGAVFLRHAVDDLTYANQLYLLDGIGADAPSARLLPIADVTDLSWSNDGSQICYLRESAGEFDLVIAAWGEGTAPGTPQRTIRLMARPRGLCWDAAGTRLCFAMDVPLPGGSLGSLASDAGCRIVQDVVPFKAESSGYRQGSHSQLFEIRLGPGHDWSLHQVTTRPHDHLMPALAPDGRRVACVRPSPRPDQFFGNQCVVVVDVNTGEETTVAEPSGPCWFPAWSPLGDRLAWLAHDGHFGAGEGTDLRIWLHDRDDTCVQRELTVARSIEDVLLDDTAPVPGTGARPIVWDETGEGIFCLMTDGASTGLYHVPLRGAPPHRPELVIGGPRRVFAFAHAQGRILAAVASPADPCRIVQVRGGTELEVLAPNREWLQHRHLSAPRPFVFSGAESSTIEGWIIAPLNRPVEGAPCVVQLNRGRFGWSFYFEMQVLAGHGFAVAYVNPHGSYGYGEEFRGTTHYNPATLEVDDIIRGVDVLVEMGVDRTRIGICGTSFGGFLVNWLVSHYPDRFAAAVSQASYCNRHSLWGTSSIGPSRWDRPGPPWEQAAFLLSRSPLSFVDRVRTPVLLIHGDRDTICPIEQAEQWYTALTVLGRRPAWVILKDEGHALAQSARPSSNKKRITAIMEWFERHLRTPPPRGLSPRT